MSDDFLPPTNLGQLKIDVLNKPPVAALPRNLADHWLDQIGRDLDVYLENIDAEYDMSSHLAAPLALLMHLLSGKLGTSEIQTDIPKIDEFLTELRGEISLETIHRRTSMRVVPATLETIFENRQVLFRMSDDNEH